MPRLRFAPSPTGFLHIGSARTYVFNWLYARRHRGAMILRIDDTDVDRNTQASLDSIFDGLRWLELEWDELYHQSERLELHRRLARALLEKGLAYRDFTPASAAEPEEKPHGAGPWLFNPGMRELSRAESDRRAAAGEPFVLRFLVPRDPPRLLRFRDAVYGEQQKSTADIEDFALLRSDGTPTYHLASCADDIEMRITHIVRGQDHLTNTFKHLLIFEAAGAPMPEFAHLPLLVAPDGSKLSKRRHGAVVSLTTYREAGFLPHAFVNFLCLLGWSPKDNRELMSRRELIEAFSFEGINRSNAVVNFRPDDPFDPKALWLNAQHLRSMPVDELVPYVLRTLERAGLPNPYSPEKFRAVVDVIRTRFATLNDFLTRGRAYFSDHYPVTPEAQEKLDQPGARALLRELADRLQAAAEFSEASVERELRQLAAERGVKAGLIINAARALLTGQSVGPSAFAVFAALGRERVLERLRRA
jgi:glutamyl-tRNA synthetase